MYENSYIITTDNSLFFDDFDKWYKANIDNGYRTDIDHWYKLFVTDDPREEKKEKQHKELVLPEIIHETKNDVYIAKFPDGTKEVGILKPNKGDENDLEKGLLYYVIKKNLDLKSVLEWMEPILDESKRPENIEKIEKDNKKKINEWFVRRSSEPINNKELQKIINKTHFYIENNHYLVEVCIDEGGIIDILNKEDDSFIDMIKTGFPRKGFLRHLLSDFYGWDKEPSLEYCQMKKLTYKFYKGCFDSIDKIMKE